jgi:hypothetical protein
MENRRAGNLRRRTRKFAVAVFELHQVIVHARIFVNLAAIKKPAQSGL